MSKTKKSASPVSRSVYQKLAEENKKLKADLKAICWNTLTMESIEARRKWHDYFQEQAMFNHAMREIAKEYFKK